MKKDKRSIRLEKKQWENISRFAIAGNSEFIRQAIDGYIDFYKQIEIMCTLTNTNHRKDEFAENIIKLANTTTFSTTYWIKTCDTCLRTNNPLPWEDRP